MKRTFAELGIPRFRTSASRTSRSRQGGPLSKPATTSAPFSKRKHCKRSQMSGDLWCIVAMMCTLIALLVTSITFTVLALGQRDHIAIFGPRDSWISTACNVTQMRLVVGKITKLYDQFNHRWPPVDLPLRPWYRWEFEVALVVNGSEQLAAGSADFFVGIRRDTVEPAVAELGETTIRAHAATGPLLTFDEAAMYGSGPLNPHPRAIVAATISADEFSSPIDLRNFTIVAGVCWAALLCPLAFCYVAKRVGDDKREKERERRHAKSLKVVRNLSTDQTIPSEWLKVESQP
jgi:hypothetical protein